MSFSRKQQPEFRGLVRLAWVEHCRAEGIAPGKGYDRAWYERELAFATGCFSSTDCDAGLDYDFSPPQTDRRLKNPEKP